METRPVTQAITKTLLVVVFWAVFLLSLYLEDAISFNSILFALVKAVVVCGLFWVLFALLVDTFVKSMLASAKESKIDRVQGGISYHLAPPSPEELAWKREHEAHFEEKIAARHKKNEKKRPI